MRLTDKERAIVTKLVAMQKAGIGYFIIDDMESIYKTSGIPKPKNWRHGMAATLRNFGAKVEREGCRFRRWSQLGRGSPGMYEFKGNFTKFLQLEEA